MKRIETEIEGVYLIEPQLHKDNRGYFMESFSERWFRENIIETHFVQDNESFSNYGVLRGLHYQLPPHSQSKLVRVAFGAVLDIAVDIRVGSPTFGRYVAEELSLENGRTIFIPRGFAHGFVVLSREGALLQYKCDNYYHPESEGSIRWDDPQLNIDWQLSSSQLILSERDRGSPLLKEAKLFDIERELY